MRISGRVILNAKELPMGVQRGYTISRGLVICIFVCVLLSSGTAGYMLIAGLSFIRRSLYDDHHCLHSRLS